MYLYVPVETVARELDGKLLLSLFAIEQGLDVIIGNRALMSNQIHRFEPGIFLTHNFDAKRTRILKIIKDLGHIIVAWDEEGLVWLSPEKYRQRRVDPEALELLERVYTWGPQHTRALAPASEPVGVNVIQAGNPRADLLRHEVRPLYQQRVEALRREFGPFILVNSNFGWLNYALMNNPHGVPNDEALDALAKKSGHPKPFLTFRLDVFHAFTKMLPQLSAAHPGHQIIVRPHPSENPSAWIQATHDLDRVHVKYDDELIPWLLAADAIIHNGCTTGIEAALLGRTSIMYRPINGGSFEIRQPLAVSFMAKTPEDLLHAVALNVDGNELTCDAADNLKDLVSSTNGMTCSQRIAENIAALATTHTNGISKLKRVSGQFRSMRRSFEKSISAFNKTLPSSPDYIAKKFPRTSVEEVGERVGRLADIFDLPRPAIQERSDRIFEIRASRKT